MKTFNVNLDQEMNVLAVAFANGDQNAGVKFVEKIQPLLVKYANKHYSPIEKEDLAQEFLEVAIRKAYDFAERYNDGKNNVLGLIYTACKRKLIDINKAHGAEKRSSKMKIGDEMVNREISLQAKIGEDGTSTMAEKVACEMKSVEDQVIDRLTEKTVSQVVKQFVASTKGRNSQIVPLVYQSLKDDWSTEELNSEIAKVLRTETGNEPNNDAIRQAKSRAMKAFRKAVESGSVQLGL